MSDLITVQALTEAMDTSAKVAQTPGLMTVVDRLFGFKLSEWKAQGDIIKAQMHQEYKEATEKGLGFQYATAFREKANVLNVLAKATDYVKEGLAREIALDEDVFWNLIDHAKTISREEMQDLIAKIIAGEYNEQGTYSMRTLQVLKSLGKNEIELLEKATSLLVGGNQLPDHVFRVTNKNYAEFLQKIGMTYNDFLTLQSLGLFYAKSGTMNIQNPNNLPFEVPYFDKKLVYTSTDENNREVSVPSFYELSEAGKQIVQHLNPQFNEYYFQWLTENYTIHRYQMVK